jgi:membrane peptidoglycan carboxypeptidase
MRVALAHATRKSVRRGGMLPVVLAIAALSIAVIVASSVLAVGGATGALLAQLEQGLPDVQQFEQLSYPEPTVIYARDGKTKLGEFLEERREVVRFADLPPLVLDATTAVEDRSFWTNEGYDLESTLSALVNDVANLSDRGGGSTITQQFVRARLLPRELLAPGSDIYLRKAKEIIQAAKLTEAFPGEDGKRRIITAYLNQIFYGHNAYGVAAAAEIYFGVRNLNKLTLAQAALLAGLPQSPSTLDPFRYAKKNARGQMVIRVCQEPPPACTDAPPVIRRNYALDALAAGMGRWIRPSAEEIAAAKAEDVVLARERPILFKAPHFVWAVKGQLDQILADREPVERGGYRVITTIDPKAQTIAEKYIQAATIAPQLDYGKYLRKLRSLKIRGNPGWIRFLRGKGLFNGALVALDYKTGDILAYVGSADYYGRNSRRLDPKFDVAGIGYRQPGSAWKPILYATGIDNKAITAGTLLMDVTTSFASNWDPKDADLAERGPVLVRRALQFSLNIPAIRALDRIGTDTMRQSTGKAGITFINGRKMMNQAGLAGAVGTVEVRVLELTAAYGAFGNGGLVTEPRYIKKIQDAGNETIFEAGEPVTRRWISPQTAYIVADILAGNTNPSVNNFWGTRFQLHNGPGGSYRVAAVKTGTTNEVEDLSTYGFLPAPGGRAPAIALGVWMGNSNHRPATIDENVDLFAIDGPGKIWREFLDDYMNGKPAPNFRRPSKGLVSATIDAYSGGAPGPWTRKTVQEYFLSGTQPGSRGAIDKPGLLYSQKCGMWMVDPVKAEPRERWKDDVRDWARRARRGQGVASRVFGTITLHLEDRSSFGGPVTDGGGCPTPKPTPLPTAEAPGPDDPDPEPTRRPRATPTPEPTPRPTCRPNGRPAGCRP